MNHTEDAVIRSSDVNKWRIFLNQFCHILKAIEEYSPKEKLRDTEVVLIKAQDESIDYNALSRVSHVH